MNEIIIPPRRRIESIRSRAKESLWTLAGQFALQGVVNWNIEPHWMLREQQEMLLPSLGDGFEGATIAQISDLHCSPVMREGYLRKYVHMINDLSPDFVVITGDFVMATPRHYVRKIARLLGEIRPKVAALACLGNHDYGIWHPRMKVVSGLAEYLAERLTDAGIDTLINESRTFVRGDDRLHFVGLGELWTSELYSPDRAFEGLPPEEPTIALCHNPDAAAHLAGYGADYVLAGHRHGTDIGNRAVLSDIWPSHQPAYVAGQYDLGGGRSLYVNRGLYHTRQIHDNHRPELTIFTLSRAVWSPQPPAEAPHPAPPPAKRSFWSRILRRR